MVTIPILNLDSIKQNLPKINVIGFRITGQLVTIYYGMNPPNLHSIDTKLFAPHLSISASTSAQRLFYLLFKTTKCKFFEFISKDFNDKPSYYAALKTQQQVIQGLPEWDDCLVRLRKQSRLITKGSFHEERHLKRREAAKEFIKEAARTCRAKFHVNRHEIVDLTEEALKELQVEEIMIG